MTYFIISFSEIGGAVFLVLLFSYQFSIRDNFWPSSLCLEIGNLAASP